MKALWIRVEAHAVDSLEVARLAELLDVDVVTAFGHYCALGGAIAEHSPDGMISDVPSAALERWGRWPGKRGRFAEAVRTVFQSNDGTYADWEESMGQLIERRAKDRARKKHGKSAETPRNDHGDSAATERDGTERDGTTPLDLEKESSNRRSGAFEPSDNGTAPPADATFADVGKRFLATFYRGASAKRLADVRRQLFATLDPAGARLKGQRVHARSEARLIAKMREVIAEGVNDSDKAIVVLLLKLGDTSDGSAPGVAVAAAVKSEERASESDVAAAERWIELQSSAFAESIERKADEQLGLSEGDSLSDAQRITRGMVLTALVVKAWRDRPPDSGRNGARPPSG